MYSYSHTIKKGVRYFVIFLLPFLVSSFIHQMPDIANLTIGGLLVGLCNWLKQKCDVKLGGLL